MCPYVHMYVNFQFRELLMQLKIIFSQSELNNQVYFECQAFQNYRKYAVTANICCKVVL